MTSPLSFQIKQKRIEHLTESTKLEVKKKFEIVKSKLEKKSAEAVAPGQSEELISQILHNEDCNEDDPEPSQRSLLSLLRCLKKVTILGNYLC